MSFKFAARAILELGKELISSDDVALSELIKNSIDAVSPRIEINANIQMLYSQFRDVVDLVESNKNTSQMLQSLKNHLIDSRSEIPGSVMSELEKTTNVEQFLSRLKYHYDEANFIEIRDTGHGMSISDLSEIFLRIGTNMRRKENLAGAKNLGDKGIGRLSAMRLGNRLQVKTTRNGDCHWNLLDIDWSLFSGEDDVDADSIVIEPEVGEEKADASDHGTTIRISALQADWDYVRFKDILQGRIARMVDPFVPGLANKLMIARHNGTRILIPCIPHELLKAAHAECHFEFRMEGDTPILKGIIDYKLRQKKREINFRGAEVISLASKFVKRRANAAMRRSKFQI